MRVLTYSAFMPVERGRPYVAIRWRNFEIAHSAIRSTVAMPLLFLLIVGAVDASADSRHRAEDVVTQYEATTSRLVSLKIESVQTTFRRARLNADYEPARETRFTILRDGDRWKITRTSEPIVVRNGTIRKYTSTVEHILDGNALSVWAAKSLEGPPAGLPERLDVATSTERGTGTREFSNSLRFTKCLFGFHHLDRDLPMWRILRESESLEIVEEDALIGDVRTIVVRGRHDRGTYTLWLDPSTGCLPRRIEVQKSRDALSGTVTYEAAQSPNEGRRNAENDNAQQPHGYLLVYDNVTIGTDAGLFMITGFDYHGIKMYPDGSAAPALLSEQYRVTAFDLNHNKWTSADFRPTVEIPNGTLVSVKEAPAIKHEWIDGVVRKAAVQAGTNGRVLTFIPGKESITARIVLVLTNVLCVSLLVFIAVRRLRRRQ